ncbi:TonB-dependent receptor [Rufibacter quisquiliarum]|uniref:Outer membrane receptor protein involved in Fe transport n=1 Tax=Rufibacter quisquiliarum TaxID=1549639 RepID=A0A839G9R7_9BACT|nr:TonB-dependent receptor [Rufibacter quisquiliarum]MBA9075702.1 outer membrane receptor protein involved in Fe transport [Rufibacter quisquiliarum]
MNLKFLLFSILFALPFLSLHAQETSLVEITGRVTDQANQEALPGVSVFVRGTVTGTSTNANGDFSLKTRLKFPFTLVISLVGYQPQEFEIKEPGSRLDIALVTQTLLGKEVVISASRVEESILKSPVAIEKLDIRAIKETPAPSFYDALENVKGVQMTTSSLTFKVPNTRGFNIPNNFRFMQLVDGVDMQAATLGVPLGNAIGPTELDIESVEITPGAASALYGMNAINGMANLITKSPFLYQGLSVYQKTGLNHVDGKDAEPSILSELAFRYAKAFHDKWAFKINASYMNGTDWRSNTTTDQNPNSLNTANPNFPELAGANNPAYDAWNKYGDENNNAVTVSGVNYQGKNQTFLVRRTGYWEKDVVSPRVDNLKFDAALHYRLGDNAELAYGYRIGKMDGVFQRGNKIQLDNVVVQNHRLELKGANYFIRSYVSLENTGDSYNVKPMVDNLDITSGGSNSEWGAKFKAALQTQLNAGTDLVTAMQRARQAADAGRVEPGTPQFNALKNTIRGINNWDHGKVVAGGPETGGAWLKQESRLYHADAQYNFEDRIKFANLLVGADARVYEVIPDGNNFVDFSRPINERTLPGGNNVYYKKFGAFGQLTKTFFSDKLKVFGSLRVDYNPEFDPKLNPRVAAVYTLSEQHNFRVSYQNGFRFPALFEAVSYVNNGNVRRVGGLGYINEGLGYLDNSYTLTSVNDFNAAVNKDVTAGMTANDAALKNRNVLQITSLSATRPEQINSFEVGYKSVLFDSKLVIDIDAYTNVYDGFLGQVEVSVPKNNTVQVGTDEAVIAMLAANRNAQQTRYRVYTNAKNKYNNYGSSLGVTYNFYEKFTLSGNVNYNAIETNAEKDIFVTAFNTPNWITNVSFGNREVVKNLGFNVVWRWQDSFLWESPLANGTVPAYSTVDAQVTYRVPESKITLKTGGTNLFNQRYIQYAAGPTIGGLYYVAITLDGLLAK